MCLYSGRITHILIDEIANMKKNTTLAALVMVIALCMSVEFGLHSGRAAAATTTPTSTSTSSSSSGLKPCTADDAIKYNPNNPGAFPPCIQTGGVDANGNQPVDSISSQPSGSSSGLPFIDKYLIPLFNYLAGVVGLVVTVSIVVAGTQYASAGDDAKKVEAAKQRIANAVLSLLSFLLLYAFLQWVVPGGFFN